MPRSLRMERNFLPNSFRNVTTFQVWRSEQDKNTEYHYGFGRFTVSSTALKCAFGPPSVINRQEVLNEFRGCALLVPHFAQERY
jgi:hypothetical protein